MRTVPDPIPGWIRPSAMGKDCWVSEAFRGENEVPLYMRWVAHGERGLCVGIFPSSEGSGFILQIRHATRAFNWQGPWLGQIFCYSMEHVLRIGNRYGGDPLIDAMLMAQCAEVAP